MTRRVAIISDIQWPYHDRKAVKAVIQYIHDTQPEEVVLIGDCLDFPQPARWSKDTRSEFEGSIYNDVKGFQEKVLAVLRDGYDGPIGMHEGNHDLRPRAYLEKYSPALAGTNAFNIEVLCDFEQFDITLLPTFYDIAPGWVSTHGHLGGISLNRIAGNTAMGAARKFNKSVVMGHCFDDQTEILTPQGWTKHSDLTEDSIVLTANKDTHALEWNKVQEVHRYTDYDELIRINSFGLDLLVTPEHGLVIESRADGSWSFPTAEQKYGKGVVFPLAGLHDQESLDLSDDEVRFLALVMADGSVDPNGNIRIAQSDDGKGDYEETVRILDSLGYEYSKVLRYNAGETQHGTHRNFDAYRFGIKSAAARALVAKYLDGTSKNPLRNLAGMSVHQMNVFLDMYTLTDGSTNAESLNSRQLTSFDKPKLDFLQELAVRTGHRSSMGTRHLTINSRSTVRVDKYSWYREPYSGVVWCVSVPNGTLVVRRNGKTAITQNTHRLGIISETRGYGGKVTSQLTGMEVGNLMDMTLAHYLKGGTANWQQGFGLLTVDGQHVKPEIVEIKKGRFSVDGEVWEV